MSNYKRIVKNTVIWTDYEAQAARTAAGDYDAIAARLAPRATVDLLHAALGLTTEAGEFADAVKKHLFYGRALDRANGIEELGDLCWYIALAARALDVPLTEVLERNVAKLRARYSGASFTEAEAVQRDLVAERKTLVHKQNNCAPTDNML